MTTRLVADVGGTNTRIALYDACGHRFHALRTFVNRDYPQFEDVIADWLSQLTEAVPDEACIAVAAGPSDDVVTMSNMDWSFSCTNLAERFGFADCNWINDFSAIAWALPFLEASDYHTLRVGETNGCLKRAAIGPGTGLGGATIEEIGEGRFHGSACEPGHMGLSPGTAMELKLFEQLIQQHGHIYAELLVSGPGLKRIYDVLCRLRGKAAAADTPAAVSAMADTDQDAREALQMFCALLGSACGDFVLANGAYAGLYLAGGILPGMIPFLENSSFLERFAEKGAMSRHLRAVPIYVITTDQPGLIGAAHASAL